MAAGIRDDFDDLRAWAAGISRPPPPLRLSPACREALESLPSCPTPAPAPPRREVRRLRRHGLLLFLLALAALLAVIGAGYCLPAAEARGVVLGEP